MHIVVDSGSYHLLNVGDVAMLQAGVERLRALWPQASIAAVTNLPENLARHCPGVPPIPLTGRVALLSDRFLGRADRFLPRTARELLEHVEQRLRREWPTGLSSLISAKRVLALRSDYAVPRLYVDALRRADLVVVTGAGVLADAFLENATGVLATLALAQHWNIPTALMGQGIGPASNQNLRRCMADVLPRVRLIALRERRESVHLLDSLGVPADRIVVTGDDAIEMANRRTPVRLGDALGVNVRVARYADVEMQTIGVIRPAIQSAAARTSAPLLALPIAHHPDCHDGVAIREVLAGSSDAPPSIAHLDTPAKAIDEVGRCRTVVTGSYHAAVFALAQGIPVVAIAASQYYVNKFSGLSDLFPTGCEIVQLDQPDARRRLEDAIESAWTNAPMTRERLLRAAAVQIEQGRVAYRRLAWLAGVPCPQADSFHPAAAG